jgi:23S rRNA U2552 (ribose-2'-O)-methylase RlmE/FtsJ
MESEIKTTDTSELVWEPETAQSNRLLCGEYNDKLNSYRNTIDQIDSDRWKRIRWYINYYDFLVQDPIINRAFFKFWETNERYGLVTSETKTILALAEAPGGFIQAINTFTKKQASTQVGEQKTVIQDFEGNYFRVVSKKKNKPRLVYPTVYTISLNRNHSKYSKYNLPSYNQHVLEKNVLTYKGVDDSGDICNLETCDKLQAIINKKVDLITADGGFDEGDDFNNKEKLHYNLIMYEIYYCLRMQAIGGTCMIKFFDMFTEPTMQMVYILCKYYTSVYIYKPLTSRPTNSEKYLVCKGFKGITRETLDTFTECLEQSKETFNVRVPESFKREFEEKTINFVKAQCDTLEAALAVTDAEYRQTSQSVRRTKNECYSEWKRTFKFQLY